MLVKITLIVEGQTERAFLPFVRTFLTPILAGRMPKLDPWVYDGPIPKKDKLRRIVQSLLTKGPPESRSDYVIALTDVYTGRREFRDAADAKRQMHEWVGPQERFFAHAAQHDFEAWLLPFWPRIQELAKHNRGAPAGAPEQVDHDKPPSMHIQDIFAAGRIRDCYVKPRDARRILEGQDLSVAARACPELRALLDRIRTLSEVTSIG